MVSAILQADSLQAGTYFAPCVDLPTSWHLFVAHTTVARPVSIHWRGSARFVRQFLWCVAGRVGDQGCVDVDMPRESSQVKSIEFLLSTQIQNSPPLVPGAGMPREATRQPPIIYNTKQKE